MAAVMLGVLGVLMLAMTANAGCKWCVCKDMGDAVLQKTLDYACGAGADCVPTHQHGPCFQPNTVRAHCSYAVNSYFQKKNQAPGSCDFCGTASISTTDPSINGCSYPATLSSAGTTNTTPVVTTPTTKTPSTGTPTSTTPTTTTSPYSTTPPNGVLGGIGSGTGPSGFGTDTGITDAGLKLQCTSFISFFAALLVSGFMLFRG